MLSARGPALFDAAGIFADGPAATFFRFGKAARVQKQIFETGSQIQLALIKHGQNTNEQKRFLLPRRGSVLDCGGPPPLLQVPASSKAPENWRTPKPCGSSNGSWEKARSFLSVFHLWLKVIFSSIHRQKAIANCSSPRRPCCPRDRPRRPAMEFFQASQTSPAQRPCRVK